jgi:predicted unusual protein kinase regulating ubiquinone biosynthesis (AarF/ABC1/UbiB family)
MYAFDPIGVLENRDVRNRETTQVQHGAAAVLGCLPVFARGASGNATSPPIIAAFAVEGNDVPSGANIVPENIVPENIVPENIVPENIVPENVVASVPEKAVKVAESFLSAERELWEKMLSLLGLPESETSFALPPKVADGFSQAMLVFQPFFGGESAKDIDGVSSLAANEAVTVVQPLLQAEQEYLTVTSAFVALAGEKIGSALPPELAEGLSQAMSVLQPLLANEPLFNTALTPSAIALQLSAIVIFGLGGAIARADTNGEAPYEPGTNTYSPKAADAFFRERPLLVAKRLFSLSYLTSAFTSGVLFDWLVLGKLLGDKEYTALKSAEPRRAKEALVLCERLGPTFIKLGQALSIRTDLVPEAYALELRQLQDAVPPFPSDEAFAVMKRELGIRDTAQVFSELSATSVASASIGQVYRGTLKSNGTQVAVKVQRPGILAEIALDLYVLRVITPIQTWFQNTVNGIKTSPEDIEVAIELVDEWGRGFVAETDYRLEAKNTTEFAASMVSRGLDAVCAPTVVEDLVRDKVLVTEWVDGTRLDRDASPDVPRLCGVAINAYLTMLLDTGVLHCDPHPGNLLRTRDGKLCILDWGMTLAVPPNLQYALLEFIAHLNVEDYDAVPQDFINLGFSPDGVSAERLRSSGITDGLSFAFRQLSAGGGPKKIAERVESELKVRYGADLTGPELEKKAQEEMLQAMEAQLASEGVDVKGVTNVMEEMSRRNRELFKLPPYVLYVARAFSTLEGIGLTIDENYAIVQECYPYLAKRLFTDRSPRAKAALRSMLGLDASSAARAPAPAGFPFGSTGVVVPTEAESRGGLSAVTIETIPKQGLRAQSNFM